MSIHKICTTQDQKNTVDAKESQWHGLICYCLDSN